MPFLWQPLSLRDRHVCRTKKAKLLCSFLLAVATVFLALPSASSQIATPVRVVDAACAKCHEKIFHAYLGTAMANASGVATDKLVPGVFLHAASHVEYQVFLKNDAAWLSYKKQTNAALNGVLRLDYFLGSGHLGTTYLYSINNYLLESPVAYYPAFKSYDMKPGLGSIQHMPGALTINATCLRCHMSGVQRPDPGTEDHYRSLPFENVGITCESCHGNTSRHVATKGAAPVINPVKLLPANRDSICISCHLEGVTSVERAGRTIFDFQPGQNISDYLVYYGYSNADMTRRGVSEVEQFMASTCKRVSGDAMSCMSCHDSHHTPNIEERVALYRAKCLACHTQPRYASAHYSSTRDCTTCHMPKSGAQNIPHVAWTDHRILRDPKHPSDIDTRGIATQELTPILPGTGSPRELALAYYNLAVNGNISERPRATALLEDTAKSSAKDAAVLRALAILNEWGGNEARASELYRDVLVLDPNSLAAQVNLGTLYAKSGNFPAAVALWRPAFAGNEDLLGLGENLATLECASDEKDRAEEVLRRLLIYSPDMPDVRQTLTEIETGTKQCGHAVKK